MTHSKACPDCLRRSWLLGLAAPYIERAPRGADGLGTLALLSLDNQDLAAAVIPQHAHSLLAGVEAMSEEHLVGKLSAAGCWATCRHDDRYPAPLREVDCAPWALIARGDPALLGDIAWGESVSIVGARRASACGRDVARTLGHDLADAGKAIVSGMAFGVDACVHRAIEGGRTVAVLPRDPTSPIRPPTARSGGGSASRA